MAILPFLILPSLIHQLISYEPFFLNTSTHTNCISIFSDGSKSQYGSGFSILFPSQHFQFKLSSVFSVLTTELYTILFALRNLLSYPSTSFVISRFSKFSLPLYYSPFSLWNPRVAISPLCLYKVRLLLLGSEPWWYNRQRTCRLTGSFYYYIRMPSFHQTCDYFYSFSSFLFTIISFLYCLPFSLTWRHMTSDIWRLLFLHELSHNTLAYETNNTENTQLLGRNFDHIHPQLSAPFSFYPWKKKKIRWSYKNYLLFHHHRFERSEGG